ncbi:hypothetical protein QYM36_012640 [Artemia franciscana]|uniref:C2H2-type domain-containing protein n=1 Tax=Artemia franciscana TaxID=6661 RepID=A0AA88HW97_ARTSF|nr:hypothetical protein QYM36_012640 [Artemia franciscana]
MIFAASLTVQDRVRFMEQVAVFRYQKFLNYNDLTDHFRKDHFLCEEGDCQRKESYTRVFRSEIDFKAHRTHNHIQGLGKAAAKQARTLELEFQLRPRNDNRGRGRGGTYRGGPRREREQVEERYREPSPVPPPASQIDVENNEEFPSLGNESGASGNGQQSAPRKVVPKNKMTVGSTSRNEEDFPSLGKPTVLVRLSSQDDSNVKIKVKQNYPQASTSSTISQTNTVKSAPGQPRAMVTRVSSTNNIKLQSSTPAGLQQDFPALPSTSKDEFRPQWGRKTEPKPMSHVIEVPKNDFPRLPSISAPPIKHIPPKKASSVNIPVQSGKAGIEPDRSKKKKSKMPIDEDRIDYSLPSDSLGIKIPKHIPNGDLGGSSNIGSKIQLISRADLVNNNQRKPVGKKPEFDDSEFPSLGPSNHVEPDRPFVKKVAEQKKKKQEQQYFNVKENQPPNDKHFGKVDSSRTSNGNRKSDITFTSSSGETFSVTSEIKVADAEPFTNMSNGAGHFVQPPSFGARNNALRDLIHELLGGDADALREFQDISKKFRSGAMSAKNYYELVQDLFGTSSFELVFSDLLVLLPDVSRQQELYEVHKGVSGAAQFTPCAVCGQILAPSDLKHHKVSHTLDNDFPSLN